MNSSDSFMIDEESGVLYKSFLGYKGLTLKNDELVYLDNNFRVKSGFKDICLVSISAGIDGSIWGLECEEGVFDYKIVKYQQYADKWYYVDGAKGVSLSAYNEISCAVLNSLGLVTLSSSEKT